MHARSEIIEAIEAALKTQIKVIQATDAVQEEDVPCVVVEEREETNGEFDRIIERPATKLRRRFRLVVFVFGHTKRGRDDLCETVEQLVVPAVYAITPQFNENGLKCALVGSGFSRSQVGTGKAAFVIGNFYDVEYMTPTYF